jgi:hypothetical protein
LLLAGAIIFYHFFGCVFTNGVGFYVFPLVETEGFSPKEKFLSG